MVIFTIYLYITISDMFLKRFRQEVNQGVMDNQV